MVQTSIQGGDGVHFISLHIIKKHDDINIYHDQPRILLHSGDEELEDALASGDRDVLTQEAMLKLCGLTIDEKCVIIKGWWEED